MPKKPETSLDSRPMKPWREFWYRGRLSRGGFWWRHLVVVPVLLVFAIRADATQALAGNFAAALLVWMLGSIWARRLHDRGRSAWWLTAVLVPVLGPLFLIYQCALRGTSPYGKFYGAPPGADYDSYD